MAAVLAGSNVMAQSTPSPRVNGNVYGGGNLATVGGNVTVNMSAGTVEKDVYGGGALANTNINNIAAASYTGTGTEAGNTFTYSTTVNLTGGTIKGDAYGGGLGKLGTEVTGEKYTEAEATEYNTTHGLSSGDDDYKTTDDWKVAPVSAADANDAVKALVYGNVSVDLGSSSLSATAFNISYYTDDHSGVVKSGRVFGCNNLNGYPLGNVTVTVWKTVRGNRARTAEEKKKLKEEDAGYVEHTYEVAAVYGGGNLANYTATGKKANVYIKTCDTSIRYVYGGGNAAAVPETNVQVEGAYEIQEVFGGGNGKDPYTLDEGSSWTTNPGADVNGNTNALLTGGYIHEAYGGSNQKGTIAGTVTLNAGTGGVCSLDVEKMVAAGKNADINGDAIMILGCMPDAKVDEIYGGADNANVNGNVELTITSGNFGKVFGGNNRGGVIKGHIKVNIEETGCRAINIDNLYLGGNEAPYSRYGYYDSGSTDPVTGKPTLLPRTSADDGNAPVKRLDSDSDFDEDHPFEPYDNPVLNVISCTSIGNVFGGGLGETATMYADPTVNINMIQGAFHSDAPAKDNPGELGAIGNVFGGGNEAAVCGNTTVNIGTATTVQMTSIRDGDGNLLETQPERTVTGAYITGNVYGGGNLADVGTYHEEDDETVADRKNVVIDLSGNTNVNIGARETGTSGVYESVVEGSAGVHIVGNVYGGGRGETANTSFLCEKAMVLGNKDDILGGTKVRIGNGTVNGNVYGGGEIARVEQNTAVTIGFGTGVATTPTTNKPVIEGCVFGAGAGLRTHGYSALVRGHSSVTVEGNAKVMKSIYGGGELATVGRYQVTDGVAEYNISGGECTVTIGGYAEIGPDDMVMHNTTTGKPDDYGHVFGGGMGILPYVGFDDDEAPWSKLPPPANSVTYLTYNQLVASEDAEDADYIKYIKTLALATSTIVTIKDNAFVKGSVYGGSENGFVQEDTKVTIQDHCQIGNGYVQMKDDGTYLAPASMRSVNRRYTEDEWTAGHLITTNDPSDFQTLVANTCPTTLPECASWKFGQAADDDDKYAPYDPNYGVEGYSDSKGGRTIGDDGHTFFGNVFGGGSGYYPYRPGKWFRFAGAVYGNTEVEIKGGHILTSVYGGNELTDVGNGASVEDNKGKCKVKMSNGTLGVPRTLAQIAAHPVTCYLFGAGKGDQRVFFNQSTNVGKVEVEISGTARIYGSVFGGGEDGHVLGDVKMDIKGGTIGTWGTSYVDGNVFGGGRGFGGDALTAGVVSGNVDINIEGGQMLGSIYGGGRLGSVGTYLVPEGHAKYGELIPDGEKVTIDIANGTVTTENSGGGNHGHITIDIKGGTIGNNYEYLYVAPSDNNNLATLKSNNHIPNTDFEDYTASDGTVYKRLKHTKGGNVFAGSMGRFYALDGSTVLPHWLDLGKVKSTKVNIRETAAIKSSVYGGGELGWTSGTHTNATDSKNYSTEINISGGTIGTVINEKVENVDVPRYTFGSVFGGGYGSTIESLTDANSQKTYPKFQAGRVKYDTKVNMSDGEVRASIYGGGEVASVGYGFYSFSNNQYGIGETALAQLDDDERHAANTYVTVSGGTIGKAPIIAQAGNTYFGGAKMGNVYGGGSGTDDIARCGLVLGNTNVSISGENTRIYHNVYGGGAYGSVGDYAYSTETVDAETRVTDPNALHTSDTGTANVTITGGIIGYDGMNNGMVFGSSRGDVQGENSRDNYMAWVNDTHVTIGTSGTQTGPQVRGSVYGSGENGHVFHNTDVKIYSGTVGIDNDDTEGYTVVSDGTTYHGPEYPSRGNVYGGGCGTDTYEKNSLTYYNPTAGIVKGNTTVTMTGGHVVRAVYGGGSMGSVGTFTNADATYVASHTEVPLGKPISCAENTGLCTVTISGGKIGPTTMAMPFTYGNVFGAGRGEAHDPAVYANLETSAYFNKTEVTISGTAFVKGSVYGGSESGHVLSDTKVTIEGGQIGCGNGKDVAYTDAEWEAANPSTLLPVASWEYVENGYAYDMYASTEEGKLDKYPSGDSTEGGRRVATDGHTFYGNVFGGGSGYIPYAAGQWLETAGRVEGNTVVEIKGGHILSNVYGGNECTDVLGTCRVDMTGGTVGVPYLATGFNPALGHLFGAGKGDKRIFFNTWTNVKETTVNVSGGRVFGSVYGGGEDGHVGFENDTTDGDATTTISGTAHIGTNGNSGYDGNVFGGGQGSSTALTAGVVQRNVTLNIQNGQIDGSVYGGGRIASVGTHLVDVTVTDSEGTKDNPIYGTLVNDDKHGNITVKLTGGTINQDAFGGCMGSRAEVSFPNSKTQDDMGVSRDVTLHLNEDVADTGVKGCVVKGNIFGCNNQNSSPRGHVKVYIHKTQNENATQIANADASGTEGQAGYTAAVNDAKVENRYDVSAVYGGGNMAAYVPDETDEKTEVIIDGCGLTSIGQVYGGGNAASAPATEVTVNGTFEIGQLFGGGNGLDDITVNGVTMPNPGANVGYKNYSEYYQENGVWKVRDKADAITKEQRMASSYVYGTGKAHATIYGGTVNAVYGGSNTKGNIRVEARATLEDVDGGCNFNVGKAFGGGRNAPMDGNAVLDIGCISGLGKAFGGAAEADVNGDVILNITNGTYGQVFGGNDIGGAIRGSIVVNIEETGCRPIIIGQLYAGGNEAAYSVYGYDADGNPLKEGDAGATAPVTSPQLNVKSFTSIGDIFGGGLGSGATMVGNPTVNINVVEGKYANTDIGDKSSIINADAKVVGSRVVYSGTGYDTGFPIPSHAKGKIGAINNVFGGGNAAAVIGNPTVNIGTEAGDVVYEVVTVAVGDDVAGYYTRTGEGTTASPYAYSTTPLDAGSKAVAEKVYCQKKTKSVDIRGNVYGGGNEATVTGNTNVVIGKDGNPTP